MDYKSLLSLADKKQQLKDNEFLVKKKSKVGQSSGPDSATIAAFKARREREELEKQRQRQREKEKLMALRAQNSKSKKKALMMKTRTKDNDFSRIVLTEDQIEEQKRVEEKLRRKGTLDLVQTKKNNNELEDKVIRNGNKNLKIINNFNNSTKSNNFGQKCDKNLDKSGLTKDKTKTNNENQMKSRNPKPAMSYDQLLNLASEKAKTEKKSLAEELMEDIREKKEKRPMTQKEKDRLKEEMYYKLRAEKGMARLPDPEAIKKSKSKETKNESNKKANNSDPKSKYGSNRLIPKTPISLNDQQKSIPIDKNTKPNDNLNRLQNDRQRVPAVKQEPRKVGQNSVPNKRDILNKMNNRLNSRDKEYNERYLMASKEREKAPNPYRPSNSNINDRARPPSPLMRKPTPKLPPIGSTYKRGMYVEDPSQYVDDDYEEEEEDDDMADFIDDGPEEKPEEEEYSRAIREIFGYDKRKYRNIDDDDIEEANFANIMQEEARSARIGLMEDLEEERKEEEYRRRKLMSKKRQMIDD